METEVLDIIIRILKGEASPGDKQKLTVWLGQDQANLEIFKQSESVWNALEIAKTGKDYDSEKAFNGFKEQVSSRLISSKRIGLYKKLDWVLRIAAIFVIFFGISFIFIISNGKTKGSEVTSSSEIISPRGSMTQLILPDGTKVWLNSESKIHYSNTFNKTSREVYLEGEGYFVVAKNPDKPFIVITTELKIRALGTIFDVKAYPDEEIIETTLIEGKLEVEDLTSTNTKNPKLTTLAPNQKVTFIKKEGIQTEQNQAGNVLKTDSEPSEKSDVNLVSLDEKVDPILETCWKDNILYFDNQKFQDLSVDLERRFAVNIHFIGEDIKELRFTGKFKDIIIEQVLDALQFASPFYYSFIDKDIYISSEPLK